MAADEGIFMRKDMTSDGESGPGDRDAEIERLAIAARDGEPRGLDAFLRAIEGHVLRYCRMKLSGSNRHSAHDVTQDVLYAVCDALPRYQPGNGPVMGFVMGIARFKVVDAFRVSGRDRSVPVANVPDEPSDQQPVEYMLDSTALQHAGLNDHQIAAVQGMVLGYSPQEQAELTRRSAVALRKDRQRAVAKLRHSFGLSDREHQALDATRAASHDHAARALGLTRDELHQLLISAQRKISATLRDGSNSAINGGKADRPDPGQLVDVIKSLSSRDVAIMRVVVGGMSNEKAAETLGVTRKSVENALTRIYRAFNVRSRHELSASLREILTGTPNAQVLDVNAQHVLAALEQLPNTLREVLVFRIALGFSAEETALALGTTAGAVRVAQHRGLAKLRLLADPHHSSSAVGGEV